MIRRLIGPRWALSSYSSAQVEQWKSATGALALKAARGSAPQEGQKPCIAIQPSDRTRTFCDALAKTAASSAKPRVRKGSLAAAMPQHGGDAEVWRGYRSICLTVISKDSASQVSKRVGLIPLVVSLPSRMRRSSDLVSSGKKRSVGNWRKSTTT